MIDYSGAIVKYNVISKNSGGQAYGGAGIWTIGNGSAPIIIENNTIAENASKGSGTYGGKGGAMFIWYSGERASARLPLKMSILTLLLDRANWLNLGSNYREFRVSFRLVQRSTERLLFCASSTNYPTRKSPASWNYP